MLLEASILSSADMNIVTYIIELKKGLYKIVDYNEGTNTTITQYYTWVYKVKNNGLEPFTKKHVVALHHGHETAVVVRRLDDDKFPVV